MLKEGSTYRYDDYKWHVVKMFEDNGQRFYAVKYYGKYKQWWHYEVISEWKFNMLVESQLATDVKE